MTPKLPSSDSPLPLSALDLQVLMVLAAEDQYGYAIMKAVEERSGGMISPEIGSLYRVLARLMDAGLLRQKAGVSEPEGTHRGRPRRYYGITEKGMETLRTEVRRLKEAIALAEATVPGLG